MNQSTEDSLGVSGRTPSPRNDFRRRQLEISMIWQLFYPESDTIPCCINVVYTFNATWTNVRSVSVRSRSPPGVQGADRLSVFPKERLGFCSQLWNSRHSWPSNLLIVYQRVLAWMGLQLI